MKGWDVIWRTTSFRLLQLFAKDPGRWFTISEASKQSGITFKPALGSIRELAALGILKTQRRGRAILCSLNADHPLGERIKALLDLDYILPPPISLLNKKIAGVLEEIRYGGKISEIYLHGSYGTNDFVQGVSDVDLAVVMDVVAENAQFDFSFEVNGSYAGADVWREGELRSGIAKGFFSPIQLAACGYPLLGKLKLAASADDLRAENIIPDLYGQVVRPFALGMRDASYAIERLTVARSMIAASKRAACILAGYRHKHLTRDGLEASRVIGRDTESRYRKLLGFKAGLRLKEPIQVKIEDGLPYFDEFMRDLFSELSGVEKTAIEREILAGVKGVALESNKVEKDTCYFVLTQLKFLDYLHDTDEIEIEPMPLRSIKEKIRRLVP